jgi:hypothetical protein
MAVDKGYSGSVYSGANKIAEIGEWNATFSAGQEDITAFGDLGVRRCYTITDCTGGFSGNGDTSDTAGQNALISQFLDGGTPAAVFLYLYTSGAEGYYGNALVDVSKGAVASGLQSFSAAFNQSEQWYTNIA